MKVKRIQCNHSTHVIVTDLITSDNEILHEYENFYSNITAPKQIPLIVATSFLMLRLFNPWTPQKMKNAKAPNYKH